MPLATETIIWLNIRDVGGWELVKIQLLPRVFGL